MKIYGIKTCDSVKKAFKFFKERNIEYEFVDFKKTSVDIDTVEEWCEVADINLLFNNKGKKYRDLKLKDLNLDEEGKKKWISQENMLIKRPVIEYKNKVIIGYDEELYNKMFHRIVG
ncbi:MAG: Arsenate reductase family protein [uncultured Campylobacterales bacterium]|uniref:Arsenate reductase family protein n=1 Tax=uncultured Campylobacterales bacterium TaxID=352960 RepID=A0A6S6SDT0_9BACT|nr:MAG: Arsenate reductase family protein [uncultured Campylobacterales bacterium]